MQRQLSDCLTVPQIKAILKKRQDAAEEYKKQRAIIDQLRGETEDKEVLAGLDKWRAEIDARLNEAYGGRLWERFEKYCAERQGE